MIEAVHAVKRMFHRYGKILFHLFSGPTGRLGDKLDHWWYGIWVRLDIEISKRP